MNRRTFLTRSIAGIGVMTTLSSFIHQFSKEKFSEAIMPALFIGHGSPMNAIEKNEYSAAWNLLGKNLPNPKAILCVSAHWLTTGTRVTAMEAPKTIHDFGGFPDELFAQQYPAKGSPEFAIETQKIITKTNVQSDFEWGLDHGTWSVLLPMFPKADIPVFQLSIDYSQPPLYHYELAKELAGLRKRGVLIVGSGNIVHNLGMISRSKQAYDWATEFDEKTKQLIDEKNHADIIHYEKLGKAARLAVPTNEHYLPLLYSLALQDSKETVKHFNEKCEMGSISMRSLIIM